MSSRFRKGDQVIVIAGNDRGKSGKILSVMVDKIIVEGINVRKKHMKPTQQSQKGQIIDIERPIHASNAMVAVDGKPVKLKARTNKQGEKEFYYVLDGKQVVYRSVKKMNVKG